MLTRIIDGTDATQARIGPARDASSGHASIVKRIRAEASGASEAVSAP